MPLEEAVVAELRHAVDAVGLAVAAGIGIGRGVVVDEIGVVGAAGGGFNFKQPPAALVGAFHGEDLVIDFDRHFFGARRPDSELVHLCSPLQVVALRANSRSFAALRMTIHKGMPND